MKRGGDILKVRGLVLWAFIFSAQDILLDDKVADSVSVHFSFQIVY